LALEAGGNLATLAGKDFATAAKQDTGNTSLSAIATNTTGIATAAAQATGNASLASIDGKIVAVNTGAVVVASGTVSATQGTSPWVVSGAVTATATDFDIRNLAKAQDEVYAVLRTDAGTAYDARTRSWTLGSGTDSVAVSGSVTVSGTVAVSSVPTTVVAGQNSASPIYCTGLPKFLNMSTATTTEIVALSGSTHIYVCGVAVVTSGTTNVTVVSGTGSNCATSQAAVSPAFPFVPNSATAGINWTAGGGNVVTRTNDAGDALCVTSSGAVTVAVVVSYAQF
jgi:hypothetical protein